MAYQKIFNEEIKQRFEDIGSELYNFKYSFELFINYLEGETDIPLKAQCLALTLYQYFNIAKENFNKLEEDLGVFL